MSADENIKTIASIYEAFGRGDVAAILAALTEDVNWAADAASDAVPLSFRRGGRLSTLKRT